MRASPSHVQNFPADHLFWHRTIAAELTIFIFAGNRPGRAETALMRAHAYLNAFKPEQALKVRKLASNGTIFRRSLTSGALEIAPVK